MHNQYLLRLRKANFTREDYKKVIKAKRLREEGETPSNTSCWNPFRVTAFTMEKAPCGQRDDISALDDQDESRWSETIESDDSPRISNHHIMPNNTATEVGGRVRLYSESQAYTVSHWEDTESQDGVSAEEGGGACEGAPFRGRSQSAPAALWKAKKYGRQLRRMSDEFDTWLDKGEIRRVSSPGKLSQKQTNQGWFSFLWRSKEEEGRK
ncbi:bcl2-associated agonist of cell death [Electrophorus electricus]|uniref:BCL2 associated agonist of cell death b n=1 Tax=Electrophorus electricus TaxID=8005 RepID=A0A4W4DXF5_ELEEL|nr:bcl2-associated agonist of cell death [Electrophorus electricus]